MRTRRSQARSLVVALALTLSASQARGEDTDEESNSPKDKPKSSLLATAAAFVPGLLLHGAGHYVAGEKDTAKELLAWEAVGFGLMAVSGAMLGFSGASRYGNEITIPALIGGSGIFLNTAFADIYGTASGGRSSRYKAPPSWSANFGYAYVDDPQFAYSHFSVLSAALRHRGVTVAPSLWYAADADNQRARLPVRYRILDSEIGDFLRAETALTYHRFGDDGFAHLIGEASLAVRIDMSRVGRSLKGSFVTAQVGYAFHRTSYELSGIPADTIGLLIGRNSYGLYLPNGGELEGYYDHRRDGFAAGLSPSSRNGSGFLGHFGLMLRQPVHDYLALTARTEIGAAWVSTLGVEVRPKERE